MARSALFTDWRRRSRSIPAFWARTSDSASRLLRDRPSLLMRWSRPWCASSSSCSSSALRISPRRSSRLRSSARRAWVSLLLGQPVLDPVEVELRGLGVELEQRLSARTASPAASGSSRPWCRWGSRHALRRRQHRARASIVASTLPALDPCRQNARAADGGTKPRGEEHDDRDRRTTSDPPVVILRKIRRRRLSSGAISRSMLPPSNLERQARCHETARVCEPRGLERVRSRAVVCGIGHSVCSAS